MTETVYIFGAGGFGREIAWLAGDVHGSSVDLAFLVDDARYLTGPVDDIDVRLVDDVEGPGKYVVAVGDAALRRRAAKALDQRGLRAATLVHPRAEYSSRVVFGPGSVVAVGTLMSTNIVLGSHVQLNSCTIGHDVTIGDFVTIAPGVNVSGNVVVEEDAFIGTGANVIAGTPGNPLVIGAGAIVAAGATVIRSVEPGTLVAGVPAVPRSRQR